ncbi:hypothetical protein MJO28_016098 [Puccinia striiformis f. sp. tritici]|uniref:Uncharacterized protein n=2 Tax=Puccinia striiformis TaxID=27350 RepID=A0A2S4VTK6_9BASI|nr:hypothetical protein Pst134EA_028870 [Puccinia striiformis f. sp. tritici]KAI9623428.1 hypothetical protein H4Q26_014597 [Puccinia striiformis f. sp. tritici PST-130]POW12855.1 hypothetical protein PSTT_04124 [Puccinia striiformis]KAH9446883.1 hypothetical protein Pst134EA_028870 [Puccinia striiformis f. sp. tritici]KAI7935991.1 hypothetical protein MJO29_015294 [Puccinia striiformis f. sp. tritici]KAI7937199.1 hypothetical protein MJO28_016098 [Puccinia striiformis f. sp. tritici]
MRLSDRMTCLVATLYLTMDSSWLAYGSPTPIPVPRLRGGGSSETIKLVQQILSPKDQEEKRLAESLASQIHSSLNKPPRPIKHMADDEVVRGVSSSELQQKANGKLIDSVWADFPN